MSSNETRNYLINEIKRFYDENDVVPGKRDMVVSYGYPYILEFINEFGSWNNSVEAAGFKAKKWRRITGEEICVICGTKETGHWCNSDKGRVCNNCYCRQKADYVNGLLDINSAVGFGFLGQRIVANKLGLELKYDCNCTKGFGHGGFDLLQLDNEKYGRIQVKVSILRNRNNGTSSFWQFSSVDEYRCDNYIMLGFNEDKSDIIKAWIIKFDSVVINNKKSLTVTYEQVIHTALEIHIKKCEVDAELYNKAYHSMKKLKDCDIFGEKKYISQGILD